MREPPDQKSSLFDELLQLLSLSATLAGLCIGGVTLFHTTGASRAGTLIDDLLAICALMFLICTYLIFWALRTRARRFALQLNKVIDIVFLAALTGLVLAGFLMVYTVI